MQENIVRPIRTIVCARAIFEAMRSHKAIQTQPFDIIASLPRRFLEILRTHPDYIIIFGTAFLWPHHNSDLKIVDYPWNLPWRSWSFQGIAKVCGRLEGAATVLMECLKFGPRNFSPVVEWATSGPARIHIRPWSNALAFYFNHFPAARRTPVLTFVPAIRLIKDGHVCIHLAYRVLQDVLCWITSSLRYLLQPIRSASRCCLFPLGHFAILCPFSWPKQFLVPGGDLNCSKKYSLFRYWYIN